MSSLYSLHCGSRCSVHPRHPACAQQNGENFPIGADPSGSFVVSSWKKRLPIVVINYILWETCPNAGKEATGLEPHSCIVYLVRITVFLCTLDGAPPKRSRVFTRSACRLPVVAQTTHPQRGRLVEKHTR